MRAFQARIFPVVFGISEKFPTYRNRETYLSAREEQGILPVVAGNCMTHITPPVWLDLLIDEVVLDRADGALARCHRSPSCQAAIVRPEGETVITAPVVISTISPRSAPVMSRYARTCAR